MTHSRAVVGIVLTLAIAAGFEFEHAWLFLLGLVMFLGWVGYLMFGPDPES